MENKKVLHIIKIIFLLIVVVGVYFLVKSIAKQETPNEYIENGKIILANLPIGKQIEPPQDIPVKTDVFDFSKDQFCVMMTLKKTIPANSFSSAVYDTVSKQDIEPKTSTPMELKQGGIAGCQPGTFSAGKYEYRAYIDDVLVAVLPFEVK